MRYQWIMFDVDGTLFDFDQAAAHALKATFLQYKLPYEPQYIERYLEINRSLWALFEKGQIEAAELKSLRFARLLESLNRKADPSQMNEDYLGHLADGSILLEGAKELVENLHGKVQMMLITNGFKKVQRPRLARSGIEHLFESVVVSDEVGVAKPDPQIFEHSFATMGDPKKEDVLIIGDSLSSDIKGGNNFGIDTCWYNPNQKVKPDHMPITHMIKQLAEIPGLLS
ncbi:MAG: YjjG family noncanonical pyrimidine nucleotidase [Bacteroidota bacterium]